MDNKNVINLILFGSANEYANLSSSNFILRNSESNLLKIFHGINFG